MVSTVFFIVQLIFFILIDSIVAPGNDHQPGGTERTEEERMSAIFNKYNQVMNFLRNMHSQQYNQAHEQQLNALSQSISRMRRNFQDLIDSYPANDWRRGFFDDMTSNLNHGERTIALINQRIQRQRLYQQQLQQQQQQQQQQERQQQQELDERTQNTSSHPSSSNLVAIIMPGKSRPSHIGFGQVKEGSPDQKKEEQTSENDTRQV